MVAASVARGVLHPIAISTARDLGGLDRPPGPMHYPTMILWELLGCVDVDGDAVPFTVLASAKLSDVQLPDEANFGVLVVRLYSDEGSLDAAMKEAIGDPPPAVDFNTTQVVLAYVEIAPCIGPELVVQRLVAPTSTLELTAQLVYAPICDDVLSRPYVLIGVEAAGYIDVVGELLPDAYL